MTRIENGAYCLRGEDRKRYLVDVSRIVPRRAGLAQSLEAYAEAVDLDVDTARSGWTFWGQVFLNVGSPAVPIEGFSPAAVIEVE